MVDLTGLDQDEYNNAIGEVKILKGLQHRNIVHIRKMVDEAGEVDYEYSHIKEKLYIVLEYCEGGTLEDYLKEHPNLSKKKKLLFIY